MLSNGLVVFNNSEKIGYLNYNQNTYSFEYDKDYTGEELVGLIKFKKNVSDELFSVFENLLPESDRRHKLYNPIENESLLDALEKTKDTHGSFSFIQVSKIKAYLDSFLNKQINWIDVKNEILGRNKYPNILDVDVLIDDDILYNKATRHYSSLSGYQNKVDVVFDGRNLRSVQKGATHLLKPFNKYLSEYVKYDKKVGKFPYLSLIEHRDMSFFKNELNFNVPESGLIKADKQFHYIVKRYDRYNGQKFEQYDFAQLMNINSEDKYKSTSEDLFKKINEILNTKIDKMEALKFYFASSIIQNNDLHLKNISVIRSSSFTFSISPLYDVISTGTYGDKENDLALSLKDKAVNKTGKFKVDSFYGLADILEISRDEFKEEARKIVCKYINEMPRYIENTKELLTVDNLLYKKSEYGDMNFIEKMEKSFEHRVSQLEKVGMLNSLGILKNELIVKTMDLSDIYEGNCEHQPMKSPYHRIINKKASQKCDQFETKS